MVSIMNQIQRKIKRKNFALANENSNIIRVKFFKKPGVSSQ